MASQKRNANQARETTTKRRGPGSQTHEPDVLTQMMPPGTLERAIEDPQQATQNAILGLQQTAGNRAVSGLIQTKLNVGPAGDKYEQEADEIADKVMRMPDIQRDAVLDDEEQWDDEEWEDDDLLQMKPLAASITPVVQRQEEEEELLQGKPLVQRDAAFDDEEAWEDEETWEDDEDWDEEDLLQMKPLTASSTQVIQRQDEEELLQGKPLVQRQDLMEDEELLQGKALDKHRPGAGFQASTDVEQQLARLKGSGTPLPAELLADMEARFGADFGAVRIHTDSEAGNLNRRLSARAFTHGRDIYLGSEQYDPDSKNGKRLLAHELTHVVQQTGARSLKSHRGDNAPKSRAGAGAAVVQRELSIQEEIKLGTLKRRLAMLDEEDDSDELERLQGQIEQLEAKKSGEEPPKPKTSTEAPKKTFGFKNLEEAVKSRSKLPGNQPIVESKPPETKVDVKPPDTVPDERQDEDEVKTEAKVEDPFHNPNSPMSPLVTKRPPEKSSTSDGGPTPWDKLGITEEQYRKQRANVPPNMEVYNERIRKYMEEQQKKSSAPSETKKPGLFDQIKGFFSKKSTPPAPKNTSEDPYHDPNSPMSPLVTKRPPDKMTEDPYHDPNSPMSPLVTKRPPDKTPEPEKPKKEKKPSRWSKFKARLGKSLIPDLGVPKSLRDSYKQPETKSPETEETKSPEKEGSKPPVPPRRGASGLLQGPGTGTFGNHVPLSTRDSGFKQAFDEPEEKKEEKSGDSPLDKMIEKLKNQLEILEQLKSASK